MLSELYLNFDRQCLIYDVYKVREFVGGLRKHIVRGLKVVSSGIAIRQKISW